MTFRGALAAAIVAGVVMLAFAGLNISQKDYPLAAFSVVVALLCLGLAAQGLRNGPPDQ